jgi:hypothetical protein
MRSPMFQRPGGKPRGPQLPGSHPASRSSRIFAVIGEALHISRNSAAGLFVHPLPTKAMRSGRRWPRSRCRLHNRECKMRQPAAVGSMARFCRYCKFL